MPGSLTPIWEDTNWGSYDDYLDEYPVPISAQVISVFDPSKVYSVWAADTQLGGYVSPKSAPNLYRLGAFANLPDLRTLNLPLSVKKLGRYSCYNSGVRSVSMSPTVIYYSTTFPSTCQIHLYTLAGYTVTPPTKRTYRVGETFDSTGMVVTCTVSDGIHVTNIVTEQRNTLAGELGGYIVNVDLSTVGETTADVYCGDRLISQIAITVTS